MPSDILNALLVLLCKHAGHFLAECYSRPTTESVGGWSEPPLPPRALLLPSFHEWSSSLFHSLEVQLALKG